MQVMTSHEWYDKDVEHVRWDGLEDVREIVLKESNEGSLLIAKDDVIELAREFELVVYDKGSSL